MEHMGILSALLPDIHIDYLYIYIESRADKMPMCMEYITSHLKSYINTSLNKAPIHLINVDASKLVILII